MNHNIKKNTFDEALFGLFLGFLEIGMPIY